MKKYLLGCLFIFGILISANAQQTSKTDLLIKINKEELKGKVLKITDSTIEFSYEGESAIYVFKKTEIARIQFASGRVEVITAPDDRTTPAAPANTADPSAAAASSANERHNKIAILPFGFIRDGQASAEAISEQVQNECYVYLSKHAAPEPFFSHALPMLCSQEPGLPRNRSKVIPWMRYVKFWEWNT